MFSAEHHGVAPRRSLSFTPFWHTVISGRAAEEKSSETQQTRGEKTIGSFPNMISKSLREREAKLCHLDLRMLPRF